MRILVTLVEELVTSGSASSSRLALSDDDDDGRRRGGSSRSTSSSIHMDESLWGRLPHDLLESHVLLHVPASGQARLRCVCKRWRQTMTSKAFRERSAAIAFHRGNSMRMVQVVSAPYAESEYDRKMAVDTLKVHKMDVPVAMRPGPMEVFNFLGYQASAHAGVLAVAWHLWDASCSKRLLRCVLVQMADQRWQELPTQVLRSRSTTVPDNVNLRINWRMWLGPAESSGSMRVSIMTRAAPERCTFRTIDVSSELRPTGGWRIVSAPRPPRAAREGVIWDPEWCASIGTGGYLFRSANSRGRSDLWRWDPEEPEDPEGGRGIMQALPAAPAVTLPKCITLNPWVELPFYPLVYNAGMHDAAVLGYCPKLPGRNVLYKLDGGEWKCVASCGPRVVPFKPTAAVAEIAGDWVIMLLLPALDDSKDDAPRIMAYHVPTGARKWYRLPCPGTARWVWLRSFILAPGPFQRMLRELLQA